MWLVLIKQYWNISLFREKPENTPYSPLLSCIISILFLMLLVMQWVMTDASQNLSLTRAIFIACSLIISYAVYTGILLSLFHLSSRFIQTLTCLIAGHTMVHLIAFPVLLLMPVLSGAQTSQTLSPFVGVLYLVITLSLAVWQFMLSAYIYRSALSSSTIAAGFASLGLLACNILTISFW